MKVLPSFSIPSGTWLFQEKRNPISTDSTQEKAPPRVPKQFAPTPLSIEEIEPFIPYDPEKEMELLQKIETQKAAIKQEMMEYAESIGMKFYVCGEEISLAEIDLDAKTEWYFGDYHFDKTDDTQNHEMAQYLEKYYRGKRFIGLFEQGNRPYYKGADAGEKTWYSENKDAKRFFTALPFVQTVVNWNDGDTHTDMSEYYMETGLIRSFEIKGANHPDTQARLKKVLFRKVLLRNEGIHQALKQNPGFDISIIHGGVGHFLGTPSTATPQAIVCVPPSVFAAGDIRTEILKALSHMAKTVDLNEYQAWRKQWVEENGDPFEEE